MSSKTWSTNDVIAFFDKYPFLTDEQRSLLQLKQYTPTQLNQSLFKVLSELKIQEKENRDKIILDWNQISLKQLTPTYVLQRKGGSPSNSTPPSSSRKNDLPPLTSTPPISILSTSSKFSNPSPVKDLYFPEGDKNTAMKEKRRKPVVQFEDDISSEDTSDEKKGIEKGISKAKETKLDNHETDRQSKEEEKKETWEGWEWDREKEEEAAEQRKRDEQKKLNPKQPQSNEKFKNSSNDEVNEKEQTVVKTDKDQKKQVKNKEAHENDAVEKVIDDIYFFEIDELSVEEEKERKEIEDIRRKLSMSQSSAGLSNPNSRSNTSLPGSITGLLQRNDDIITPSRRPSSLVISPSNRQPPNDLIETISELQQVIEVLNNEKFALQEKNDALSHELGEKSKVLSLTIQEMKMMEEENHALLDESQKLTENLIQLREKYDKLVAVAKRTTLLINRRPTGAAGNNTSNQMQSDLERLRETRTAALMEKVEETEDEIDEDDERMMSNDIDGALTTDEEEMMMSMFPDFEVIKVDGECQTNESENVTEVSKASMKEEMIQTEINSLNFPYTSNNDVLESTSNIEILRRATSVPKSPANQNNRASLIGRLPESTAFSSIAAASNSKKGVDNPETHDAMTQTDRVNSEFIRQSLILATRSTDLATPRHQASAPAPQLTVNLNQGNNSGRHSPKSPQSMISMGSNPGPLINLLDISHRDTLIPFNISASSLDTYDKPTLTKQLLSERDMIHSLQNEKQLLINFYENELNQIRSSIADEKSNILHMKESYELELEIKQQMIHEFKENHEKLTRSIETLKQQLEQAAHKEGKESGESSDREKTGTPRGNRGSPRSRKLSVMGGDGRSPSSPSSGRRHESPTIREESTMEGEETANNSILDANPTPTPPSSGHSRGASSNHRKLSTAHHNRGRRKAGIQKDSPLKGRLNSYIQGESTDPANNSQKGAGVGGVEGEERKLSIENTKELKQTIKLLTSNNELLQEKLQSYQQKEIHYQEEIHQLQKKLQEIEKEKKQLEEKITSFAALRHPHSASYARILQNRDDIGGGGGGAGDMGDLNGNSIILSEITDYDLFGNRSPATKRVASPKDDSVYHLKYDGHYHYSYQPIPTPESAREVPWNPIHQNHQPQHHRGKSDFLLEDDDGYQNQLHSNHKLQPKQKKVNGDENSGEYYYEHDYEHDDHHAHEKSRNQINPEDGEPPGEEEEGGGLGGGDEFFLTQEKWIRKEAIYLANLHYLLELLQEISQSYQTMLKNISSYQQQFENDDQPDSSVSNGDRYSPSHPPAEAPIRQNWFVPQPDQHQYQHDPLSPPPLFSTTLLHHSRSKKQILQRLLESNFHFLNKQQNLLRSMTNRQQLPNPHATNPATNGNQSDHNHHQHQQQQLMQDQPEPYSLPYNHPQSQEYYQLLREHYQQQINENQQGNDDNHNFYSHHYSHGNSGKSQNVFQRLYNTPLQGKAGSNSRGNSPKRKMVNATIAPFITLVRPKSANASGSTPSSTPMQHHQMAMNNNHLNGGFPSATARMNQYLSDQMVQEAINYSPFLSPRTMNDLPAPLTTHNHIAASHSGGNIPQRPKSANHAVRTNSKGGSGKQHRKIVGYDFPVRELIQTLGRQAANNEN